MHGVTGTGRLIAGRYRLQDPIGRGAMGIVWRGRDELLARDVAVKEVQVTSQATAADAEVIYQRTLREARTAARLNHPSVVTVYDVVEEDGSPWIVMELIEARSLDRVITEDGPLPPDRAAELGATLVSALATAHAAGVLHRDVKPSNVLVTPAGRAILTDFGIATFAEDLGLTQTGMVVGTPGFTAPERIRGDIATPASDLWSLGATLYAAVEGRGPFDRVGGSSVITAGVAGEDAPRAPSAGPLGPVIDALLSRDPGTRPDSTTAARLLADAATAARTGPQPLRDGWLAAEAGREPGSDSSPTPQSRAPMLGDSGFLDPPDYEVLQMPAHESKPLTAQASYGSGESPAPADSGPVAAGGGLAAGAGLAGGAALAGAAALAGGAGLAGGAALADSPMLAGSNPGSGSSSIVDPSSGPVLWGPMKSGSSGGSQPGGLGPAGPGGTGPGGTGPGGPGAGGPGGDRPAAKPARSSRRWRLMVAAGGIAALAVAAVVTWNIFQHSGPASALGSVTPPGTTVQTGGTSPANSGTTKAGKKTSSSKPGSTPGSAGTSNTHSSSPAPGHHTTKPTTGPGGGKPSPTPSGHTSASPTPSPTPTPTPTPSTSTTTPSTGPTLPAGYKWHRFTAATMDAVAGLKIGLPDAWTQSVNVPVAQMVESTNAFHLDVDLSYWEYATPLREAQYLESVAASAHAGHGFQELLLSSVNIESLGGYVSHTAAELKYSWNSVPLGYNVTQLDIVVQLNTSAGEQPYEFELWAPTSTWGSARAVLTAALPTFRPLPS